MRKWVLHFVGFGLVALGTAIFLSASGFPGRTIDPATQHTMTGGGPGYECYAITSCSACTPPAGCVYSSWGPYWQCTCTTNGTGGCTTAGNVTYCSLMSGFSCTEEGGGPAGCGGKANPNSNIIVLIAGVWSCAPACTAVAGSSTPPCINCAAGS